MENKVPGGLGENSTPPVFKVADYFPETQRYIPVEFEAEKDVDCVFMPVAAAPSTDSEKEQLPKEASSAYGRYQAVARCLDEERVRRLVDAHRKGIRLSELVARNLVPHLAEVYAWRLEQAGPEIIDPSATHLRVESEDGDTLVIDVNFPDDADGAVRHLACTLEDIFRRSAGSGWDIWQDFAEWSYINQIGWALGRMVDEQGAEALLAWSTERFDSLLHDHLSGDQATASALELLGIYVQQTAELIVEGFDPANRALAELEWLLGFREHIPPGSSLTLPRDLRGALVRSDHLLSLNSAHYQSIRDAIAKKRFGQFEGSPWPTVVFKRRSGTGYVQLRPRAVDSHPLMPPDEIDVLARQMWCYHADLTDYDVDTLDLLNAVWLSQARSADDRAWVDVDQLLRLRGIQPKLGGQGRRGGFEAEQRLRQRDSVERLENLWVNLANFETFEESQGLKGRRKRVKCHIESRALVLTDRLLEEITAGRVELRRFLFQPGLVLARFLVGPGRQAALLSVRAIEYDTHRKRWEKRLARYLSWQWRIRATRGNYARPFKVVTLIEQVGERLDSRHPSRTRERLERALDTLEQDSVIGAWQYEHFDESITNQHGWGRAYLGWTVIIEPPEIIKETYRTIRNAKSLSDRKRLLRAESLRERLGARRKELGLTQLQVAEEIGIPAERLGMVEQGAETVSRKEQQRICRWLDAKEPSRLSQAFPPSFHH